MVTELRCRIARGVADMLADFGEVRLAVEVTLKVGKRQYRDEGEPVTDHVGRYQDELITQGYRGAVAGLFVAPRITSNTLQWFYGHAKLMDLPEYRGRVRVIPMELRQFTDIIKFADSTSGALTQNEVVGLMKDTNDHYETFTRVR